MFKVLCGLGFEIRNLLRCEARGTCLINTVTAVLYSEGYWIPSQRGSILARMLHGYLLQYSRLAVLAVKQGLNRWPMVPKLHMLAHTAEQMRTEAQRGSWIQNPLATANQQQEDYIGRPSRLSRRVHASQLHVRVIERSLLASWQALHG